LQTVPSSSAKGTSTTATSTVNPKLKFKYRPTKAREENKITFMPISRTQFTGVTGFEATAKEMQDAEDNRDGLAEEKTINPTFAKLDALDQSGTTTGS
jgi:hypothetical protein